MKIFENKSIFKKIILILVVVLITSFTFSGQVQADDGIGGKLLNPVMTLFVSLGDGVMTLLQDIIFHMDVSLIQVDTSSEWWAKVLVIVGGLVVVSAIVAATILTAGAAGGAIAVAAAALKGGIAIVVTIGALTVSYPITTGIVEGMLSDSFELPTFKITPQEIFSNKIPLLDVDFFNPSDDINLSDGTKLKSTAAELKTTIANWYNILKYISLVALLSVLVYIGIRILISSTSNDKAKYKQMLLDWLIAICLLYGMQYIMAFSNLIVNKVTNVIDSTHISANTESVNITQPESFIISNDNDRVTKAFEVIVGETTPQENSYYRFFLDGTGHSLVDEEGNPTGEEAEYLLWPAENFMEQARIKLQLLDEEGNDTYVAIGWKLIYVVIVIYTLIFLFTYLKRVIYMAFLTIISPLVALTYPLDKINDGKAQAFNMWFKEYIFNLLIQPMHLILYTVLISSAMELASKNIIYVVVALFFMVPAEKLLRSFFGFEKARTPGLLAGPAGAALMMSGMNKLLNKSPKQKSSSGGSPSNKNSIGDDDKSTLKFNDKFNKEDAMLGQSNEKDNKNNLGEEEISNKKPNKLDTSNKTKNAERNLGTDNQEKPQLFNKDQNEPQFWEDRLMNKMRDKGNDFSQSTRTKMNVAKNKFNSSKVGKGIKKPIRGVKKIGKKLNDNSRLVNSGVKLAKGATAGVRYYGHKKLEKLGNRIKDSHPVRTVLKGAGGATAAVAGGIIGGVSGDPSKAFQYATTGFVAGARATDSILPQSILDDQDFIDAYDITRERYYSDDIDEYDMKKYIDNFQKDYDNKVKIESKLGSRREAKDFMENYSEDYIRNGITDINDMIAAYKIQENGAVSSKEMAISTVKYAKRLGKKPKDMSKKTRDDWRNTIMEEFQKRPYFKESNFDAEEEANNVFDRINAFYKAKNG